MKISSVTKKLLSYIENTPQTILGFLGAFFMLIVLRLLIESGLGLFSARNFQGIFFEFSHTFLFFLFAFLVFLPLLSFLTKDSLLHTSNLLLFGFLIILTPPIIDTILLGQNGFWSFYEFDGLYGLLIRYLTFFGDTPSIGITYGVRLEVFLVTLGSIFLIFFKTRSVLRSFLGGICMYSAFFLLGTFPSWITLVLSFVSPGILSVTDATVAKIFLTPESILSRELLDIRSVLNIKMSLWYAVLILLSGSVLFFRHKKSHFIALYNNARFPQVFYHGGLVSVGALLAIHFENLSLPTSHFSYLAFLILLFSAVFAWLASVISNDFFDVTIDEKTNPARPLIQKTIEPSTYRDYGIIFFLISLLLAGIVSSQALLLIFGYQICAWVYSAAPFRLKRFPIIATLLASFASILVLVAGYLAVSENHSLASLPNHFFLYLLFVFAVCLPIKDFKDIPGDKRDSVYTLPVIFGETWGKRIIGSFVLLSFSLSPFIINEPSLVPLAVLFGSFAFWVIQNGNNSPTSLFNYRRFSLFLFLAVFGYGVLSLVSLFFDFLS
jgi:4-hydroxybenzoate polyprenyltransferase